MGAFFLIRHGAGRHPADVADKLDASLREQGFAAPVMIRADDFTLHIYPKQAAAVSQLYRQGRDFCAATGTLVYRGNTGREALAGYYRDFDPAAPHPARLYGNFCIIIRKAGELFLLTDRLGIFKVYQDRDSTYWCSSFLAAAAARRGLTLQPQSVYEYVFHGATYGGSTLVREIGLLDGDAVLRILPGLEARPLPPFLSDPGDVPRRSGLVTLTLDYLQALFADIASAFPGGIDTGLSGGFDSRLTLALLLDRGVQPELHVYGRSGDPDVVVAQQIAAGEGLALNHIDKSAWSQAPDRADPAEVVADNLLRFDGYPNDGLFTGPADWATREARCAHGHLMLNGGGGEIFRNFFYRLRKVGSGSGLVKAFYMGFDPRSCSSRFDPGEYTASLAAKLDVAVGEPGGRWNRRQMELAYPRFRCRYWMGRNNAVNNRLGPAMTPFIEAAIVDLASLIPLSGRNHGRFEARLIRQLSEPLAAYPSAYGHDFLGGPPLGRRLRNLADYARPLWLRARSYRIKQRLGSGAGDDPNEALYRILLPGGLDMMTEFFRPEALRDPAQRARAYTLELLASKLGATV